MTEKMAFFGGSSPSVFRTLHRNCTDHAALAKPFVQLCADEMKNATDGKFDLVKRLGAGERLTEEEVAGVATVVKTIGHLTAFYVSAMDTPKADFKAAVKAYTATTGDRPGMLAAVAIATSTSEADFKKHATAFVKAAAVAEKASGEGLAAAWAAAGVSMPKGGDFIIPAICAEGAGALNESSNVAGTLAKVVSSLPVPEDKAMEAAAKKVKDSLKTVIDFGCPPFEEGKITLPIDGIRDVAALNQALPDIAEIKREIEKRGFTVNVNLFLSFFWLAHDLVLNGALLYGMYLLYPYIATNFALKWLVVWPIYSFVLGTTLTGLWVIGHECGHRAFAGARENDWINDVVGFVVHTPLLVPFWAWRYSHHKHHMFTNHLLDGETHVPNHKNGAKMDHAIWKVIGEDAFVFWNAFQHLFFGWPLYLIQNATGGRRTPAGQKINRKKPVSHFRPESQVFDDNQRSMILPGTLGCLAWLAFLAYVDYESGLGTTLFWYWGAYCWTNFWLVLYTWLHHSDKEIPHFSDGNFTYMRGATCSIDRAYPAIINYVHHHIGSTHVMHHISFQVPHYRAENATKVYRERYPHLYRFDTRSVYEVMCDVSSTCHYVEDVKDVQYYKHLNTIQSFKKNE
eukprot:TRINITY_DN6312_c0_g7_i1.p2 TRINITY_DN6312_c0_g7~~TRINITY_DN6312_c0_g7_i1.p2  ORF type:complete len:626 (+),score=272.40 TRINITY_DN6312_c0_g7_i1:58-1935(+)